MAERTVEWWAGQREPMGARTGRRAGKKGHKCFIGRYIYRSIDSLAILFFAMKKLKHLSSQSRQEQYDQLRHQLSAVGWISEGYVQDRGPGAGGPCYQWTRKVRAKTVSVALSRDQFIWLQQAIANWKSLRRLIKTMQQLSRAELFETVQGPRRRKRLGKKVLGLN